MITLIKSTWETASIIIFSFPKNITIKKSLGVQKMYCTALSLSQINKNGENAKMGYMEMCNAHVETFTYATR